MVFHTKSPAHVCSGIIYGSSSNYRDSTSGISEALCGGMRHPTEWNVKAGLNCKTGSIYEERAKTVHIIYCRN